MSSSPYARRLCFLLLMLACVVPAAGSIAAPARIAPEDCAYGPTEDAEFAPFGEDALTCRYPRRGKPVLVIVSVDIERNCARRPGPCDAAFPLPKILDSRGREVGRLPDNFPGEAAVSYVVLLEGSRAGWPRTIRLVGESQGAGSAPLWTPLRWQPTAGRYSQGRPKP